MSEYATLRASIPPKCFERPVYKSDGFLIRDLCLIFFIWHIQPYMYWSIYALVQGTALMSIWYIAHECGHGSFSTYPIVNDILGFILHTGLLVPYFAWKRTHATHHAKSNHLLDGESSNPGTKKGMDMLVRVKNFLGGGDAFVIFIIAVRLLIGWHLYMFLHQSGSRRSPVTKQRYRSQPNHWWSPELFPAKMRLKIALGTGGVLASAVAHVVFETHFFGPYLVLNAWVMVYAWLQHTSPTVPHYGEDKWTWLLGSLATIDRPYPRIINELHHHAGTTHVCHHLFPEIPHYHAVEATEAIGRTMDLTPILHAMWSTAKTCHYVEGVEGVQYYRSIIG